MASIDDFWLVDFGERFPHEPAAIRPALVIGPTERWGTDWPFVFVVPSTTTIRSVPFHVEVEPDLANGLDQVSALQVELARSVSCARLVTKIGRAGPEVSFAVENLLRSLLGY